jgi:2-oxoglutarate ferredoxin oxidoreductase subunit alpha
MGLLKLSPQRIASLCKTIVLGGEAGEGVKSAGHIIAHSLIKSGHRVFVYDEYPSLIRGGHNSVHVTYSPDPVYASNREIDILVCLNRDTFDQHKKNLNNGSIVLYDKDLFKITDEDLRESPCELVEVPVTAILKREKLPRITKNIIMVASALCVAGVEKAVVEKVILKVFGDKENVIEANKTALEQGFDNALEYFGIKKFDQVKKTSAKKGKIKKPARYLIAGNDAIGLGSLRAGIQFYAAYPMTPASTILDFMIAHAREYDFAVKQTEDEIAAINMAIGAAFAGARSMVGSAGGGFSLMVEGLGLAAITETPLVVVIAQRPGPAT